MRSPDPYESPDFDAGFMNDKRDMAPMVWGYIKSRETARRMSSYAGEVTAMHPHFAYDSPARAFDLDLETTNAYAGPNHITAGIQHGEEGSSLFCLFPCGSIIITKAGGHRLVVSSTRTGKVAVRQCAQFEQAGNSGTYQI